MTSSQPGTASMPHSGRDHPQLGFQALILCGPGLSFNTFTSTPEEYPKALIPIANRPMVWYPMEWCYRMGVSNITLITPRSSKTAIETALKQNPYLTAFPMPSATVLAPPGLSHTMGTAELLRLPEVQASIKGDFMVLPCDLVCEVPGEEIVGGWLETQSTLAGASDGDQHEHPISSNLGVNGEKSGRRGGLGVWYPLSSNHENPKHDTADFLAAARLERGEAPLVNRARSDPPVVRDSLCKVAYAAPMDSLKDKMDSKGVLHLRQSLLKRYGHVKVLTRYRDAHVYIFPFWVKEMAAKNDKFESIGEDLVGWWAKAGWQDGLADKLHLREAAHRRAQNAGFQRLDKVVVDYIDETIDLVGMTTTSSRLIYDAQSDGSLTLPARQRPLPRADTLTDDAPQPTKSPIDKDLALPEMLGYIHPCSSGPDEPMIRRIDNAPLLLSMTLRLAKLDPVTNADHPFTHAQKIAFPEGVAQRCTITKADCIVGENTAVEEKCVIKESAVGSNCKIASGSRLTKCLVMDNVVVGERCTLTGCVIGRRSKIGENCDLKDCEVQDGNVIPPGTEARGEKFMIFDGLDNGADGTEEGIDLIG